MLFPKETKNIVLYTFTVSKNAMILEYGSQYDIIEDDKHKDVRKNDKKRKSAARC